MSEELEQTLGHAESMADYEEEITRSFKRMREGDIIQVTVIGIQEDGATVDLNSYSEGFIPLSELSNDPKFSIFSDLSVGDKFPCYVMNEDNGNGSLLLSKRKANETNAWTELLEAKEQGKQYEVTISSVVNGGVITFLHDLRGFIPA